MGSENIIDGVHTYIAKYYLDLWVFGIFIINYVWGLISGYISAGNRSVADYLSSAVLLGCIGFMFFSDFLTILMIILQLSILTFQPSDILRLNAPVFRECVSPFFLSHRS